MTKLLIPVVSVMMLALSAFAQAPAAAPPKAYMVLQSSTMERMAKTPRKIKVRLISEIVEVPGKISDPVLSKDLRMQFTEYLMSQYPNEVKKLTLHDTLPVHSAIYSPTLPITVHNYETSLKSNPSDPWEIVLIKGFKYVPGKFKGDAKATPLIEQFQTIIWGGTKDKYGNPMGA